MPSARSANVRIEALRVRLPAGVGADEARAFAQAMAQALPQALARGMRGLPAGAAVLPQVSLKVLDRGPGDAARHVAQALLGQLGGRR